MNAYDKQELIRYRESLGDMSSNEALQLAIDAEQIAKDCGPQDIAFIRFKREQVVFETYAQLLEKKENENV